MHRLSGLAMSCLVAALKSAMSCLVASRSETGMASAAALTSRVSSNPFVALRRSSWPFVDMFLPFPFRPSWITALPFPTLGGSLSILLQPLRVPSLFFVALRGYVFAFAFSPFVSILSPTPPLADPYRSPSNPFVALRCSSWPFVDKFLPFPFRPSWINPFTPSRFYAAGACAGGTPALPGGHRFMTALFA